MAIVDVEFECENCQGIITLRIDGGLEALNGDMPPSCLYCRAIGTLKPITEDGKPIKEEAK